MKRILVGLVIATSFVVVVVWLALQQVQVKCEVCVRYAGRQVCEAAGAADRTQAVMQATTAACAQLSSGVTAGIQCSNTQPVSLECSEY